MSDSYLKANVNHERRRSTQALRKRTMVETRSRSRLARRHSPPPQPPAHKAGLRQLRLQARNKAELLRPNASQNMNKNIKSEESPKLPTMTSSALPPETGGNIFNVSATGGGSHEGSVAENNVEVYGRSLSYVSIDASHRKRGSAMEPTPERPSPHPDADPGLDQHSAVTSTPVRAAGNGQRDPVVALSNITTHDARALPQDHSAEPSEDDAASSSQDSQDRDLWSSQEPDSDNDQTEMISYDPVPMEERNLKAQDQVLRAQLDLLRRIATNASTEESLQTLRKVSLDHAKQHHSVLSTWEKMVRVRYETVRERLSGAEKIVFATELLRLKTDIVTQDIRRIALRATLTPEWFSDTGALRRYVLADLTRVERTTAGMIQGNDAINY